MQVNPSQRKHSTRSLYSSPTCLASWCAVDYTASSTRSWFVKPTRRKKRSLFQNAGWNSLVMMKTSLSVTMCSIFQAINTYTLPCLYFRCGFGDDVWCKNPSSWDLAGAGWNRLLSGDRRMYLDSGSSVYLVKLLGYTGLV